MTPKRFESILLTATLAQEEKNRKKKLKQDKIQSKIQRVNRLTIQALELESKLSYIKF